MGKYERYSSSPNLCYWTPLKYLENRKHEGKQYFLLHEYQDKKYKKIMQNFRLRLLATFSY